MKKTTTALLLAAGLLAGLSLYSCRGMSSDTLKSSIEIVDIETKWVSKYYQPWPPRLILVPLISFRVKNVGSVPLEYVYFNAVFKFKGDPENLGDNFLAAIRGKAVRPGETSDVITLKSNFGVEGKNLDSFKDSVQWKPVELNLFARSKGSQFVLLGQYDVSRIIDFKEPEAVK